MKIHYLNGLQPSVLILHSDNNISFSFLTLQLEEKTDMQIKPGICVQAQQLVSTVHQIPQNLH